jgi:hypothetical protein
VEVRVDVRDEVAVRVGRALSPTKFRCPPPAIPMAKKEMVSKIRFISSLDDEIYPKASSPY